MNLEHSRQFVNLYLKDWVL